MRLIDADALKEKATLRHGFDFQGVFVRIQDIEAMPTIDSVPVVRCKDCAFWLPTYISNRIGFVNECINFNFFTTENNFCSFGERKKDVCSELYSGFTGENTYA